LEGKEMIATLSRMRDRFLGRGDAAITIPIFDGALKPNRILDDAEQVMQVPSAEDLATNGTSIFIAEGSRVVRLNDRSLEDVATFSHDIAALACMPDGGFAVALKSGEIRISGGFADGATWTNVEGKPLRSVNSITLRRNGRLLVSDGSAQFDHDHWCHDLMSRGQSGRLVELDPVDLSSRVIAKNLSYAFGVCEFKQAAWLCESWKHRILQCEPGEESTVVLGGLPGYPSRISPSSDGGFWLTAFAGRTQLIEFVLREPQYRKRMMAEVDPQYWIAPALSSGHSFLEPLQGAGVKMRGVLKPWAPPRSYGLVIKLSSSGSVQYSFHSRLDGTNHGVVAAVECQGELIVLSKGSGRLLRLPVVETEKLVMQ
jgi:hypothetical protein